MITEIKSSADGYGVVWWEAYDATGGLVDAYQSDADSEANRRRATEYFRKVYGVADNCQ